MKLKHIAVCSSMLLTAFLYSCKDSSQFTINGTIKNPGSLKLVYLIEADSSQVKVVDSTTLGEGGKFQFKHVAAYPNLYKLRIGNNNSTSGDLPDGASNIYDLIAKNGDNIDFSTDNNDNAHAYTISGSDES